MIQQIHEIDSLKEHQDRENILKLVNKAIKYFPDLNGTLYIGITTNNMCSASADKDNMLIRFNPKFKPVKVRTIFHEIMHLVKTIPQTEEACDIFSLARIPEEMVVDGEYSCYMFANGNKQDIINAKKALEYRASGKRDYLKHYRKLNTSSQSKEN